MGFSTRPLVLLAAAIGAGAAVAAPVALPWAGALLVLAAALQKLRPEGKAEDDWGYYQDAAERKAAIQSDKKPATAKILDGWKTGNTATLIVEVPMPYEPSVKTKAVVGLAFDGTGWRVREERMDFAGTMLGEGN